RRPREDGLDAPARQPGGQRLGRGPAGRHLAGAERLQLRDVPLRLGGAAFPPAAGDREGADPPDAGAGRNADEADPAGGAGGGAVLPAHRVHPPPAGVDAGARRTGEVTPAEGARPAPMKEYRQNVHRSSLLSRAALCTATAVFCFVHSPRLITRRLRLEETLAGVLFLILGPAA